MATDEEERVAFDEDDGGGGGFFGDLFLNEEYQPFTFYFGKPDVVGEDGQVVETAKEERLTETLLASKQCCTDWDLTGQIVWPAAFQLSYFMHNPKYTPLFKGKRVLELGSGAGLSGFVAAKYAKDVVLTDGNEIVMRLLNRNVDFVKTASPQSCPATATRLFWGEEASVKELVEAHGVPEVLCGADIIMWPNYTLTLMQTIAFFFAYNPAMEAYVSYVVRAHSTTRLLYSCAEECGLAVDVITPDQFLPPEDWQPKSLLQVDECNRYVLKIFKKRAEDV